MRSTLARQLQGIQIERLQLGLQEAVCEVTTVR